MPQSKYPSKLSLPQTNPGVATVLEYLIAHFPQTAPSIWRERVANGKVHWHGGSKINEHSAYQAQQRVYYYREVENEPTIPFDEEILFQNEHLLVAFKPHFLPVTPGGVYVDECLQHRLRHKTGLDELQALHRLDRATAGLVMFSIKPESRRLYHELFKSHAIEKTYQAVATVATAPVIVGNEWRVENRLEKSAQRFRMQVVDGVPNSESFIRCIGQSKQRGLFELKPITGKTHQLRVHMQHLGFPILHERYYPVLQEESADNYHQPLQLLAKKLRFIDPISGQRKEFECAQALSLKSAA